MPTATKTYSFTANTTAVAAQVEQNFQDILDFLNVTKLDSANLQDSAVTAAKLAANAVTTAKILDANVTGPKIAADAIDGTKIADNSIGQEHLNLSATTDALAGAVSLNTSYVDICSVTPPAGTYLAIANICAYQVGNDGTQGVLARFSTDSQARSGIQFAPTDNNVFSIVVPIFKIATCDGVTALKTQARTFFSTSPNDVRAMGTAWGQEPGESRLVCIPIS